MPGTLYIVATPIGNLKDISQRALETLQSVDLIACEDTRHSAKLLNAYGISKKLVSYHDHNENSRSEELIELLKKGSSIALISDAGTPLINDPGYKIVQSARAAGVSVIPIPGAVAFVNAAIVSGLKTEGLFFGGFLPSRKGERRRYLQSVAAIPATLLFYESPHRLAKALADCAEILGPRNSAVVRELTKIHEEVVNGNLEELASRYASNDVKGEIVLVIEGYAVSLTKPERRTSLADRVRDLERAGEDRKSALKLAAKEFGIPRAEAYRRLISEQK
jgi:16S rRNA (cytidine1402-2'-O)-methyltransferase